jgi:hypothetical protein
MLLSGPPHGFGRIRPSAEIQAGPENRIPDPFDLAQGRGEHSRTTIKTFGGDAFRTNSHHDVLTPRRLLLGNLFMRQGERRAYFRT